MTTELGLTIQSTLAAYKLPGASANYFAKVFKGEPSALMPTAGQALARWHVAESRVPPEGPRVISGSRMVELVYLINCYWPLSGAEGAQQSQEDDIATVLIDLPNDFIALTAANYTIGGYAVSALTVEDTTTVERATPFPNSESEMRVAQFELHARVLEAT